VNPCRSFFALAPFLVASLVVRSAGAQETAPSIPVPPPPSDAPAPPASAEALPAPTPPVEDEAWKYRYDLACDRLVNGDFAKAAELFDELLPSTRDPRTRALVILQSGLAHEWQRRGLALVKQSALGESALSAKAVGERSTDEIAILYTSAVIYGLGSGLAFDELAQASSTAAVILPMLLLGGASAGTVALLDSGRPLRYGVPQSIVSGMYIGLEEGLALSLWGLQSSSQWQGQTVAGVTWGFTTAGAVVGGALGATVGTTPGRASFVGSTSLWGGAVSALATEALGAGNGGEPFLAASIGVGGGAIAGLLTAGPVSPSIARVRFLDLGAIAGGVVAGGIYLSAANRDPDPRAASGVTALGIAGGLAVAWAATSKIAPDRIEAQETPKQSVSWSPTLVPANRGMMLGIQGAM
jgi:hypothetical protein